jgi:two-component system response regulator AtoC
MLRALIVEDDPSSLASLATLVRAEGFEVEEAGSLAEARRVLNEFRPDVLLLDLHLPDGSGVKLLEEVQYDPAPDHILITGQASVETAVAALRSGAVDYLTKPPDMARLKMIVGNFARTRGLKDENRNLRSELRRLGRFGRMVGASSQIQELFDAMARVAPTDATVMIVGETGTGKEVVAQTLHELSARASRPFIAVNCGAISPQLIESELFGHEKGSFTGADRQHRGVFERADGGTLLLDEITEMNLDLQVKLLRVLETSQFQRVGGVTPLKVDVRVLAATNRSPAQAVSEGKLREDLYYRLNVFPLQVPTLRERGHDIEVLAQHFLQEIAEREGRTRRFSPAALSRLMAHSWPGNVRELKNAVQRAAILGDEEIGPESLPLEGVEPLSLSGGRPAASSPSGPLSFTPGMPLATLERAMILASVEHFGGDKKKAAEALGISVKTLYVRLREYRAGGAAVDAEPNEDSGLLSGGTR